MSLTNVPFEALNPAPLPQTLQVLDEAGFRYLTPVQADIIPRLCNKENVVVESATGTGKTLAFVIPVVHILGKLSKPLEPHQVGAIIVSPTRELASQIFHVGKPFFETINVDAELLVGGTDVSADVEKLQESGANVLIGTPGRLSDIKERSSQLDFGSLKVIILDEADRLLETGLWNQVLQIIEDLPKARTTGLFSATQIHEAEKLAKVGLQTAYRTERSRIPASLSVEYLFCEADEKPSQLVHFLLENATKKIIVYFITCASVDYWGTVLPKLELLKAVSCVSIHGKLKQRVREKALDKFTNLPSGVLFCTDVAARGLDILGVDWVVQYDPPQDPSTFVHRAGRSGRMGRPGQCVVFLLPKEDAYPDFLRINKKICTKEMNKPEATNIVTMLRTAAKLDRDVMEKGLRAFVSFFRAYKEHECSYILPWKKLELGKHAMGFGLLQLPSMPELKKQRIFTSEHFVAAEGIDLASIKFRDKTRERQRKRKLDQMITTRTKPVAVVEARWRRPLKKRLLKDEQEINEDYRLIKKQRRGSCL